MKQVVLALTGCLLAGAASAQLLTPQAQPQPATATTAQRVAASAPAAAPVVPPRVMEAREVAVLQVLDKVSARVTTLRVPVGSSAAYGLIFVAARSCQVAPPSEPPESAAFLEINEVDLRSLPRSGSTTTGAARVATSQRLLFSGWMFASSPALSALEHPTYDVTVLACEQRMPTPAQAAAGGEEGSAVTGSPSVTPTPSVSVPASESAQPED